MKTMIAVTMLMALTGCAGGANFMRGFASASSAQQSRDEQRAYDRDHPKKTRTQCRELSGGRFDCTSEDVGY